MTRLQQLAQLAASNHMFSILEVLLLLRLTKHRFFHAKQPHAVLPALACSHTQHEGSTYYPCCVHVLAGKGVPKPLLRAPEADEVQGDQGNTYCSRPCCCCCCCSSEPLFLLRCRGLRFKSAAELFYPVASYTLFLFRRTPGLG